MAGLTVGSTMPSKTVFTFPGRRCTKCDTEHDESRFRMIRHRNGRTYWDSWCKGCKRDSSVAWKKRNRDRTNEINRRSDRKQYWINPQKFRDRKLAQHYASPGKAKDVYDRKPHTHKKAWWRIHELTRSGRLLRPDSCSTCGGAGRRIEAHHPDHSLPEHVVWLCSRCHGATRRKEA